jgi:hypothetical protein
LASTVLARTVSPSTGAGQARLVRVLPGRRVSSTGGGASGPGRVPGR